MSKQPITRQEIHTTRLALQLALQDTGSGGSCDWLSSRPGGDKPQDLTQILGKSGCYGSKS